MPSLMVIPEGDKNMAKRIDGKLISAEIRMEIKEQTAQFIEEHGYAPGLAVIIVGGCVIVWDEIRGIAHRRREE